jgi:hypothetical protein
MPKPTSLDRDSPHWDRTAPRNVVLTRHPAPLRLLTRFPDKWLGCRAGRFDLLHAERFYRQAQPAPMIADHYRAYTIYGRRADAARVFRRTQTQVERRSELRRMRMIATLLLVRMAAIYLAMRRAPADWVWAAYLQRVRGSWHGGPPPIGSLWSRFFGVPLELPIPHTAVVPENKRRIGAAMGRFSTKSFLSLAWPSHACHRSTLSVLRHDGSRTSTTRERSRPPRDPPFRMRSTLCRKRRSTNGSPLPRGAGSRPFPPHRSASRGLSILWALGADQTLLGRGLDLVEMTLERYKSTIVQCVAKVLTLDPEMGRRQ